MKVLKMIKDIYGYNNRRKKSIIFRRTFEDHNDLSDDQLRNAAYLLGIDVEEMKGENVIDRKILIHRMINIEIFIHSRGINNTDPIEIFIYRDGVSISQLEVVAQNELDAIKTAIRNVGINQLPNIEFLVVQKRVNARFFEYNQNQHFHREL